MRQAIADILDEAQAIGTALALAEADLQICILADQAVRARAKYAREILANPALKERHGAAKSDLEEAERDMPDIEARRAIAHARWSKLFAEHLWRTVFQPQPTLW